jgi:hypothetical protein
VVGDAPGWAKIHRTMLIRQRVSVALISAVAEQLLPGLATVPRFTIPPGLLTSLPAPLASAAPPGPPPLPPPAPPDPSAPGLPRSTQSMDLDLSQASPGAAPPHLGRAWAAQYLGWNRERRVREDPQVKPPLDR